MEMLAEAEAMAQAQPATLAVKAELMSRAALGLAAAGEKERARALLKGAEEAVPLAMIIEQPGLYASVGEGWARAGDAKQVRRLFDRALGVAESLKNARPRALAVVATLRAMGRAGVAPDATVTARLDALYAGLKDPW
jgi:hypothetical protein